MELRMRKKEGWKLWSTIIVASGLCPISHLFCPKLHLFFCPKSHLFCPKLALGQFSLVGSPCLGLDRHVVTLPSLRKTRVDHPQGPNMGHKKSPEKVLNWAKKVRIWKEIGLKVRHFLKLIFGTSSRHSSRRGKKALQKVGKKSFQIAKILSSILLPVFY